MSVSEANYEFTVRFYEFRNTLGLQCGACGNGGAPACCDHVQQRKNCNMTKPFTCDTRFRFSLRPFGASVATAPSRGFPYHTPSNGGNSDTFFEAPGGFLALPNPFTISSASEWTVSCMNVCNVSPSWLNSSNREGYSSSLMHWIMMPREVRLKPSSIVSPLILSLKLEQLTSLREQHTLVSTTYQV